jgi:hypothetical protein
VLQPNVAAFCCVRSARSYATFRSLAAVLNDAKRGARPQERTSAATPLLGRWAAPGPARRMYEGFRRSPRRCVHVWWCGVRIGPGAAGAGGDKTRGGARRRPPKRNTVRRHTVRTMRRAPLTRARVFLARHANPRSRHPPPRQNQQQYLTMLALCLTDLRFSCAAYHKRCRGEATRQRTTQSLRRLLQPLVR